MIHNITYRSFVYQTEDEEKVIQSINYLFPNILPEKSISEDHYSNKITILQEKISKKRYCRDFIEFLNNNISNEDKHILNEELSRRMDDKGNFFLRFSKQDAFDENLKLTYSGNAIHVRIKIASYPVSKDNAINVAKKLFDFLE